MPEFHAEPFIYLAGLTHRSALIAWGGFYFRINDKDESLKLVDDHDLDHIHPPRHQTIGARSEPYGESVVEVRDAATSDLVATATTNSANHVFIDGLQPDREYTYKITVNGEEWAEGERRDWIAIDKDRQGLLSLGNRYDNRFRTHPSPDASANLTFALLGDFGTGVRKISNSGRRQKEVADALARAVDERNVRLILTTGDNIYAAKTLLGIPIDETGDEDDDWFFTFYQPYRYIINRVPVYPCVGNHDTGETEKSDDRQQLLDNFYINERFAAKQASGTVSLGPGLFYRFKYGADIEFVCIDTSRQSALFGDRFFEHPNHVGFVEAAFPDPGSAARGPKWRVPFSHHPPYCAGPEHRNSKSMIKRIVPLLRRSGVPAYFSGHEHNFQHSEADGIQYFITGAGGKVRRNAPSDFDDAHTVSWAAEAHFLVVAIEGDSMTVTPIGELGGADALSTLSRKTPSGGIVVAPIHVDRQ